MGAKRIINGKTLTCIHCGGDSFDERQAQLNTAGMTFLKLDWLNKSATVFVCETCGRLEWFLDVNEG
jgi:predicted nucleic-acid-binding Zn-ribbon protein